MVTTENSAVPVNGRSGSVRRRLRSAGVAIVVTFAVIWTAAAIYFGGNGGGAGRLALAAAFVAMSAWVWLFARKRQFARWSWVGTFGVAVIWFAALRPSHSRDWKREVSILPGIAIAGDRARISGYRDFVYRSRDDFDVRHREREILLSELEGVDLFISYFGKELMAHTFLSFRFKNAEPLCVSIEARPEQNENFGALPGIFKRFELIYVVGDERDIVLLRTNHRGEDVYLYPINVSAEAARRLFLVYAAKVNQLAKKPEFYHLLSNSCTANIVRNANEAGHRTSILEGRFILNGLVDRYLYEAGLVENTLGFEETRKRARITDVAKQAGEAGFSNRIRNGQ